MLIERGMDNGGARVIRRLRHELLVVDDEWAVDTERGFAWWPAGVCQRIEIVGTERGPDGMTADDARILTDLVRDVPPALASSLGVREILMDRASLAGPVYDPRSRTIRLSSLVRVYPEIVDWMTAVLGVAAVIQADIAVNRGERIAAAIGARRDLSAHPVSGVRYVYDEIADVADIVVAGMGVDASSWYGEFEAVHQRFGQGLPVVDATSDATGLTVEFPYGPYTSICRFAATEPHPDYGHGLLTVQAFPFSGRSESDMTRLALEWNAREFVTRPIGYGLGSYTVRDGMLHFSSFWPNAIYRAGSLANALFAATGRAQRVSEELTGVAWTPESFRTAQSAAEQMRRGLEEDGRGERKA